MALTIESFMPSEAECDEALRALEESRRRKYEEK